MAGRQAGQGLRLWPHWQHRRRHPRRGGGRAAGTPPRPPPRIARRQHHCLPARRVGPAIPCRSWAQNLKGDTAMSRKKVNAICRRLPGAEVSDPWGGGHDAWKVGGKMFACIGAVTPGVSVKTGSIETAEMLIDAGVGVKAPYLHRSWVNLPWGTSADELRHRLRASYKLVREGLPKKVRAQLAPFP